MSALIAKSVCAVVCVILCILSLGVVIGGAAALCLILLFFGACIYSGFSEYGTEVSATIISALLLIWLIVWSFKTAIKNGWFKDLEASND